MAVQGRLFNVTLWQPPEGTTTNTYHRPIFQQQTMMHFRLFPKRKCPPLFHFHNIDDHQSGSDTVNNEKLGLTGLSAGSGFLSDWLLINGADEGHDSSPAWDYHSARRFSHPNCPHVSRIMLTLFYHCISSILQKKKKFISICLPRDPSSFSFFMYRIQSWRERLIGNPKRQTQQRSNLFLPLSVWKVSPF